MEQSSPPSHAPDKLDPALFQAMVEQAGDALAIRRDCTERYLAEKALK